MSLRTVAEKEFSDARRSRTLLVVVGLFVVAVGGVTYLLVEFILETGGGPGSAPTADSVTAATIAFLSGIATAGISPIGVLVPVIGLLLGYKAVVGERETGRIKLLLGLPHSRRDVVLGKLLGRVAVAGLAVVAGFLATAIVLVALAGTLSLEPFLALLLVTLVFVAAYVSLGIGISALSPSSGWATALVVAVVALFQVLWGAIFFAVRLVALDLRPGEQPPLWFRTLQGAAPPDAYRSALTTALEVTTDATPSDLGTPPDAPLPVQDWFGFVWLALWTAVPLAVGYLQFRDADLT